VSKWKLFVNLFCHDLPGALSRSTRRRDELPGPVGRGRGAMADADADHEATNGASAPVGHFFLAMLVSPLEQRWTPQTR
jgi:hypothetical protein